jgi:Amt family ammonium transporter
MQVWGPDGWASALAPVKSRLFGSGAVDYGGSAVVHVTGGLAALIACVFVGPRVGRFKRHMVMDPKP